MTRKVRRFVICSHLFGGNHCSDLHFIYMYHTIPSLHNMKESYYSRARHALYKKKKSTLCLVTVPSLHSDVLIELSEKYIRQDISSQRGRVKLSRNHHPVHDAVQSTLHAEHVSTMRCGSSTHTHTPRQLWCQTSGQGKPARWHCMYNAFTRVRGLPF